MKEYSWYLLSEKNKKLWDTMYDVSSALKRKRKETENLISYILYKYTEKFGRLHMKLQNEGG